MNDDRYKEIIKRIENLERITLRLQGVDPDKYSYEPFGRCVKHGFMECPKCHKENKP